MVDITTGCVVHFPTLIFGEFQPSLSADLNVPIQMVSTFVRVGLKLWIKREFHLLKRLYSHHREPFHNFGDLKSIARPSQKTWISPIHGFSDSEIGKGLAGYSIRKVRNDATKYRKPVYLFQSQRKKLIPNIYYIYWTIYFFKFVNHIRPKWEKKRHCWLMWHYDSVNFRPDMCELHVLLHSSHNYESSHGTESFSLPKHSCFCFFIELKISIPLVLLR